MGGGDLNMKKSWHPLLLKNQERVWLEEKKALEEKKKLDQLRKEKEEERQLQELQRLQEEKTGKKRTEKLEWMYSTPATGSSQNPNDLEDYLLGKKRVDKILTADENAKLGASHKNFIAVQNANTVKDIAAKIKDDPLFAIKQQEQATYDALMNNPLRLRELQMKNGIKPKKTKEEKKKEKEEKKRRKEERRHRRHRASRSPSPLEYRRSPSDERYSRRSRHSRSPVSHRLPSSRSSHNDYRDYRNGQRRYESRSPSPPARRRDTYPGRGRDDFGRKEGHRSRSRTLSSSRSRSPPLRKRSLSRERNRDPRDHYSKRPRMASPPRISNSTVAQSQAARAARLASMTNDATTMDAERQVRLKALLEKEKADLEADEAARARSKGFGEFLSHEQKKVFGGIALEDRIKRGRGGMVADAD